MRTRVSRGVLSTAVVLMAAEAAGSRAVASDGLGSASRVGLTPTNRFEEVLSDAERISRKGKNQNSGNSVAPCLFRAGIFGSRALVVHDIRPGGAGRTGGDAMAAQHVRWLTVRLSWFVKLYALIPGGQPYLALSLE